MAQSVNVPGVGTLNFPDDMSQADMAAAIQRNFPQIHAQAPDESTPAQQYKSSPSLLDKYIGANEAGLSFLTSIPAAIPASIAALSSVLTNGKFGTQEGVREAGNRFSDVANAYTYEPRTDTGREYAENIGDAINTSGIVGVAPLNEMAAAGTLAAPATRQVMAGASKALEPEIYAAKNIASKISNANVLPTISNEKAALAKKAADIGIQIPAHMLSDNSFVRMAGEFLDNLPLSGSVKAGNKEAFNQFLIKQIGGDESKTALTPDVFAEAQQKAGKTIGDTFSNIQVPADDPILVNDIQQMVKSQSRELEATNNIINGNIEELVRLGEENNGVIPGSSLKLLHSEIAAKLRGNMDNYPGMRGQLSDFQNILEDAIDRQITDPEIRATYDQARMQYAKSKVLEPLVAKSDLNGVSPQLLMGRLNATLLGKHRMAVGAAGDLGDAAQVAQNFMREAPSSKTAERSFLIGAMTELAGAGKAALGITVGNIYNRFGPRIAQAFVNQALGKNVAAAPAEIGLLDLDRYPTGSPFSQNDAPYSGLLSADQTPFSSGTVAKEIPSLDYPLLESSRPMPIQRAGERQAAPAGLSMAYENGVDFYGNQVDKPAAQVMGNPLLELQENQSANNADVATQHQGNTIDFPLRQEVLNHPEIAAATDAFRAEATRLESIINSPVRTTAQKSQAVKKLAALQDEFANGMSYLGISNAAEAHGLNRPLYESGISSTKLPIQKSAIASEIERIKQARKQSAITDISNAQTVDQAIEAFTNSTK